MKDKKSVVTILVMFTVATGGISVFNTHTISDPIEDIAPSTQITFGTPYYTDGINDSVTRDTVITLTATDNPGGSGVLEIHYIVYGDEIIVPGNTVNFTFDREWLHIFEFWAVDNDGNVEDINERIIKVDNSGPISWMTLYHLGGGEFTYGCVGGICLPEFNLNSDIIDAYAEFIIWTEDQGVFPVKDYTIYYRIEGPPGQKFFGLDQTYYPTDGIWRNGKTGFDRPVAFQIRDESGYLRAGKYMVEFYAVDVLGNIEPVVQTRWFLADTYHPFTTIFFSGPYYTDGRIEWITNTTCVHLEGSDEISGVKMTKYRVDNGVKNNYEGLFSINKPGEHTIYYHSIDWLNNVEPEKKLTVIVDDISPATKLKFNGDTYSHNGTIWTSSSTSLQLHSEDAGCGLKSSYYRVYLGDWIPYTDPFILEDGIYTIDFYAEDNLGNSEVPSVNTVGIDTQAPVITINKPRTNHLYISGREILTLPLKEKADAIILGQTKIDVQVTDRGCGVETIHLYIDGELRHKSFDGNALSFDWNKRSIGIHTCEIWTQDMLGNSCNEQFKIWMLNI